MRHSFLFEPWATAQRPNEAVSTCEAGQAMRNFESSIRKFLCHLTQPFVPRQMRHMGAFK